ncbi:msl6584 [Mesorhizobium japonicum MAFF 303099]|uniref:Msl6584 protein n=1 Tax=Mesorhizobium japonicum (strain LMG 29417 / CECT 9101 / MAFF 303099) TaxID=266835 RepID=Q988V0_RHILO|nr:msl6584 [Mesorhizobium japonicum MAFF 303099]
MSIAAANPSAALLDTVFMATSFRTAAEALHVPAVILLAALPAVLAPNQTVRRQPICGADAAVRLNWQCRTNNGEIAV